MFCFLIQVIMWEDFDSAFMEADPTSPTEGKEMCFVCHEEKLLINDTEGSLVCHACGAINHYLIEKKSDMSTAMADGTNINVYLPKSSLGTSIAGPARMKIRIVTEWWKWVYKEKSFYDDKKDIEEKCHKGKLSQAVIDNSLNLYKRVSELKHSDGKYVIIRGTNRKAIMAAAVYYGAKLQRQPRCPKEIADLFDLEVGQMTKGCKRFSQMVDMSEMVKDNIRNEATDYVFSLCHRLDLDRAFRDKACEIVKNIMKLQLVTNHQPPSVAASTLLITKEFFGHEKSLKKFRDLLSEIFRVSDVTIQKTFKELRPWSRVITDNDLTDTYYNDVMLTMGTERETTSSLAV